MDREKMVEMAADVSVVIPCYNSEDTIAAALQSVLHQTVQVGEVIVVDDGSRDRSPDLVAEKFPQVVLVRQENSGAAAARNAGLSRARGSYLALLDADDQWLPDKLERQLPVMAAEPEVGVVTGRAQWCDAASAGCPRRPHRQSGYTIRRMEDVFAQPQICTSAVLLRREVIDDVGLLDGSIGYAEDVEFYFRIVAAGWKFAQLHTPLALCRIDKFMEDPVARARHFIRLAEHQVGLIDRWSPESNPHSPLSPQQHSRARSWACLRAANYMTAARDWCGASAYFREAAREPHAPISVRAAGRFGAFAPRLADALLARYRTMAKLRRINEA